MSSSCRTPNGVGEAQGASALPRQLGVKGSDLLVLYGHNPDSSMEF